MVKMPILKHVIGKSTLEEGFTVPRSFEEWIGSPEKGKKRFITLLFENGSVTATLRHLNNARGHVQVKYEDSQAVAFRGWMNKIFKKSIQQSCGEYVEIHKVDNQTFKIVPFPQKDKTDNLIIHEWLFHRGAEEYNEGGTLAEIQAIIQNIGFVDTEGQSHYNRMFEHQFANWAWEVEKQVVPELGLKSDFAKDGAWVEIEFGNARTYYQDFLKFMLAFHHGSAQIGVLVVPSESFARHLCNVGRQKAVAKGKVSYSGMIHFEKVRREFKYLEFMLSMPIAIAGIGTPK